MSKPCIGNIADYFVIEMPNRIVAGITTTGDHPKPNAIFAQGIKDAIAIDAHFRVEDDGEAKARALPILALDDEATISGKQALKQLEGPAYDEETAARDFEYVATKLGISVDELESYMQAPNRTYQDYKSQEYIFKVGAAVMKGLGLEVGGKR